MIVPKLQVNKFFREFWKLKRVDKLYEIYPKIEQYLPSFLQLHKGVEEKRFESS
jgi:hypothetical protein